MISALYVEKDGCYFGLKNIDPWDEKREARLYSGPYPVIAHPPCKRWGRYWHGSPVKPHQFKQGDDGGCFAAGLHSVRIYGGILEHPKDSHAWRWNGLTKPPMNGGWVEADEVGGWTCCVWQGHYGHLSGKPTWLYAHSVELPDLIWGKTEQRISPIALKKYGYEKARRIGMMAMIGGKNRDKIRAATPEQFRNILISIVGTFK